MPEIGRFYGIVIKMFYNDHSPPHFHAEYVDDQMLRSDVTIRCYDQMFVDIDTPAVIGGRLAPRATSLVLEWAARHQDALRDDWIQTRNRLPLTKIDPLP